MAIKMYGIRNCHTIKPGSSKENLDEKKAMALMLAQPSMIRRPVLELRGRLVVGFKPELYSSIQ